MDAKLCHTHFKRPQRVRSEVQSSVSPAMVRQDEHGAARGDSRRAELSRDGGAREEVAESIDTSDEDARRGARCRPCEDILQACTDLEALVSRLWNAST